MQGYAFSDLSAVVLAAGHLESGYLLAPPDARYLDWTRRKRPNSRRVLLRAMAALSDLGLRDNVFVDVGGMLHFLSSFCVLIHSVSSRSITAVLPRRLCCHAGSFPAIRREPSSRMSLP